MVKREPVKVTVGSAATVNALADTRIAKKKSVKNDGAWRYPGGIIQRMESTMINGRGPYTDHKDPGEPRRRQESNFFITLNTNRACGEKQGAQLQLTGKEAMRKTLKQLSQDSVICKYLKFGPKHPDHYGKDLYEDVVSKVEWTSAVEIGENNERLHCHIWLTVHHYSQIQVNMPMMQRKFKELYNANLWNLQSDSAFGNYYTELSCNKMPYIQVKLLPESNWTEVIKQYIHKAMMEHTGDDNEDIPTQPVGV